MSARIDHFMYAFPSLDDGVAWATEAFGTAPAYGGAHVGLGTRNALLSLGATYLEIIAPDPAQSLTGTLGETFARLRDPGLVTWAVQGELSDIARTLAGEGVETAGPNRTERKTAEGDLLVWELLFPRGTAYGGRMPFFIDWLDCPHPSDTNPRGGEFTSLEITTPAAEGLTRILESIGVAVAVSEGEPGLAVSVESARGTVVLASTAETSAIAMR